MSNHQEKNILVAFFYLHMVSTIKVPVESFLYATYITQVIIELSLFIVYSLID